MPIDSNEIRAWSAKLNSIADLLEKQPMHAGPEMQGLLPSWIGQLVTFLGNVLVKVGPYLGEKP